VIRSLPAFGNDYRRFGNDMIITACSSATSVRRKVSAASHLCDAHAEGFSQVAIRNLKFRV